MAYCVSKSKAAPLFSPVEDVVLGKQVGSLLLVGAGIPTAGNRGAAQPPRKRAVGHAIEVVEQQPGGGLEVELLGVILEAGIACPSVQLRGRLIPAVCNCGWLGLNNVVCMADTSAAGRGRRQWRRIRAWRRRGCGHPPRAATRCVRNQPPLGGLCRFVEHSIHV